MVAVVLKVLMLRVTRALGLVVHRRRHLRRLALLLVITSG